MVGTPINLVRGLIRLGLIKDLNLAITVRRPLEWLKKDLKERWSCRESNPGPLAYRASALPPSYNSHQEPPLFLALILSFKPFFSHSKGLRTVMARLRSLSRPSLICPRTKLIGVPTIRLPAVITLKIPLNQQSYAATILIRSTI